MKKSKMRSDQLTRIRHEKEMKQMTITVYTYPNNKCRLLEIPDDAAEPLVENNQQLSHKEFKAALEEWDSLVKKIAKPDAQPLSDYAMSRESIYENHPKL